MFLQPVFIIGNPDMTSEAAKILDKVVDHSHIAMGQTNVSRMVVYLDTFRTNKQPVEFSLEHRIDW